MLRILVFVLLILADIDIFFLGKILIDENHLAPTILYTLPSDLVNK